MTKNWTFILWFLAGLVLLNIAGIFIWQHYSRSKSLDETDRQGTSQQMYHCPMHPDVMSHKPGQCPICKMDLVPIEDHGPEPTADQKILFYRHPMQADVTSKFPAKDSMGMDYIPVYADNSSNRTASTVDGRAGFTLSQESQQKIGVTSTAAILRPLTREIRATGRVAYDPELYAAIEEYQQAVIAKEHLQNSSYSGFIDQSAVLVKSSATRLKLLGLTDQQIRSIARGGSQAINLILPEGRVWVYAEVFEYEVGGLKPGQRVEAEAPSIPGTFFKGTISSISPLLNAPTRTIRVRAEVPDPKRLLRPDTYLNVRILIELGQKLAIPDDSVLHTGTQSYVFVKDETDHFYPREVELGAKVKGFYEVVSGLKIGEQVVTGANFLIDSESRLKAVIGDQDRSGSSAKEPDSIAPDQGHTHD